MADMKCVFRRESLKPRYVSRVIYDNTGAEKFQIYISLMADIQYVFCNIFIKS